MFLQKRELFGKRIHRWCHTTFARLKAAYRAKRHFRRTRPAEQSDRAAVLADRATQVSHHRGARLSLVRRTFRPYVRLA
jgi:hypothetical protein